MSGVRVPLRPPRLTGDGAHRADRLHVVHVLRRMSEWLVGATRLSRPSDGDGCVDDLADCGLLGDSFGWFEDELVDQCFNGEDEGSSA